MQRAVIVAAARDLLPARRDDAALARREVGDRPRPSVLDPLATKRKPTLAFSRLTAAPPAAGERGSRRSARVGIGALEDRVRDHPRRGRTRGDAPGRDVSAFPHEARSASSASASRCSSRRLRWDCARALSAARSTPSSFGSSGRACPSASHSRRLPSTPSDRASRSRRRPPGLIAQRLLSDPRDRLPRLVRVDVQSPHHVDQRRAILLDLLRERGVAQAARELQAGGRAGQVVVEVDREWVLGGAEHGAGATRASLRALLRRARTLGWR